MMTQRLTSATSALLVGLAILITGGTAYAQSRDDMPDATYSIWSGLQKGVNMATGIASETTPPATHPASGEYVALGDSVAAGLGLANPTDSERRCSRTAEAYSFQVAQARGLSHRNLACSGATAGDLVTAQRVDGPNIPAQLPRAFANGTPGLITITAGANDARWTTFVGKCYQSTCGTRTDTTLANTLLTTMQAKLHYAMLDIQRRSSGDPPTVLLTGYYNPVSAVCSTLEPHFTASETVWLDAEVDALNQTLQNVAAHYENVTYIPVDFTGHDLCSSDSWIQGVDSPAPFHPTTEGQTAIAEAILARL